MRLPTFRRAAHALLLGPLLVLWAGCAREPEAWFRECASERGLAWEHVRGREQRYWFPEIMGGGVGLVDVDRDGALDVYLVQSGDLAEPEPALGNRLFRNLGGARFEDATARVGGDEPGYGMGCAIADADQDGDDDVYVTNLGPNVLYLNQDGVLRAAAGAGVADPAWSTSAAWLDHDADGDLDLCVANYVRWSRERELVCRSAQGTRDYCSPLNYDAPTRATLYRNDGGALFHDVSEVAGLGEAFGNGLGVVAADLDQDGRQDLYVANDMMPNQLWHNRGDGTFDERALLAGCAVNRDGAAEAGMGIVAADIDEDGDLDLFVTHLRDETNTLYRNQGGMFSDQTSVLGLGAPSLPFTGFGVGAADFDRDGALDLYVANGAVTENRVRFTPEDPYAEPNLLFAGRTGPGGTRFEEVLPRGGTAEPMIGNSRGAALGDLDEDGDVDVIVVENGARVRLLENLATSGHWIGLDVREASGGTAHGAALTLRSGTRERHRAVTSSGSYCSSNDARVLCGLGDAAEPVEVSVRWIDGTEERFGPLAVDAKHVLRRGQGAPLVR
jgi:enediyne biosynthesis protein E4